MGTTNNTSLTVTTASGSIMNSPGGYGQGTNSPGWGQPYTPSPWTVPYPNSGAITLSDATWTLPLRINLSETDKMNLLKLLGELHDPLVLKKKLKDLADELIEKKSVELNGEILLPLIFALLNTVASPIETQEVKG